MSDRGGSPPEGERPRMFGGHLDPVRLPWAWAADRLVAARNYWIATTRPDGRPHTRPVWGVWSDDAFWFSTGSAAERNLSAGPAITVHLESGSESVIVEGVAAAVVDPLALRPVIDAYNQKYAWNMDPDDLPGPFWQVRPTVVFGWLSDASGLDGGSAFHATATRWRFRTVTSIGTRT